MGRGGAYLTQNFVDQRRQQESIGLKECVCADPVVYAIHMYDGAARALDCPVCVDKCGGDFWRAYDVNLACLIWIRTSDELIQLGHQRHATLNRHYHVRLFLHESKSSINDMKRSPQPVIPITSGDALYRVIPVETSEPMKTLTNDGFLVV